MFEGTGVANLSDPAGPSDANPDLARRYLHHYPEFDTLDSAPGLRASLHSPHDGDLHSNGPPLSDLDDARFNTTAPAIGPRAAQNFYLRLMPLGASITEGVGSPDGNGYRKWLRSQLRWKGWKVNMVGSKQNGNMADKDNEGHPRWLITQVHQAFLQSQ